MKNWRRLVLPLAGILLANAGIGFAAPQEKQQPAQDKRDQARSRQDQPAPSRTDRPLRDGQPSQTAQRSEWPKADRTLAACAAIDNQAEIALARFAQDKLQNEEAKQFAMKMVTEHEAYLQKLQRFAPEASQQLLNEPTSRTDAKGLQAASDKPNVTRAGGANTDRSANVRQTAGTQTEGTEQNAQPVDFVQLGREIAQESLSDMKSQLERKQGAEFDECFMGFQIAAHGAMKAKLTVFQRHASGELGGILAEGVDTADKHRADAEEIIRKLVASSSKVAATNASREQPDGGADNK